MQELTQSLKELGLSEKESAVYLSALEMGESSVQELSQKADVARPTTYIALESLLAQELIEIVSRDGRKLYCAKSPQALLNLMSRKKQTLTELEQTIESFIPRLMALHSKETSKPQVRYIEGEHGLRIVREMFQSQKGDAFQIVPHDIVEEFGRLSDDRSSQVEKFVLSGDTLKVLLVTKKQNLEGLPIIEGTQVKVIDYKHCPVSAEITVRGNNVYFHSLKDSLLSVIVTSSEIAQTMTSLFNLAWTGAEKLENE